MAVPNLKIISKINKNILKNDKISGKIQVSEKDSCILPLFLFQNITGRKKCSDKICL